MELDTKIYDPQLVDKVLQIFAFVSHETGERLNEKFTDSQRLIINVILNRGALGTEGEFLRKINMIMPTQYGKSSAIAAGIVTRAAMKQDTWGIVAGTKEKARIIMDYAVGYALGDPIFRKQLDAPKGIDRLKSEKNKDHVNFVSGGAMRVFSAETKNTKAMGESLMGFGARNLIEDEAGLIRDEIHSKVMRMIGGHGSKGFLMKVGNPFNREAPITHFYKSSSMSGSELSKKYFQFWIDYRTGISEGRYTEEMIDEARTLPFFDVFYECKFPDEGMADDQGWRPLLKLSEIENAVVDADVHFGVDRVAFDIAGGGRNYTVGVRRSTNLAEITYKSQEKNTLTVTGVAVRQKREFLLDNRNIWIDMVGVGRGAADQIRATLPGAIGFNGGMEAHDKTRFTNLRAETYWAIREWLLKGGRLLNENTGQPATLSDWMQLSNIWYKEDSKGRVMMMPKEQMLKKGIDSPDVADALSMTFARRETYTLDSMPDYQIVDYHEQDIMSNNNLGEGDPYE